MDLEIILQEITKTSQYDTKHVSLQKDPQLLPPRSRVEITLSQPVTPGDRVYLHYHFNARHNHKTIRGKQGTTDVETISWVTRASSGFQNLEFFQDIDQINN